MKTSIRDIISKSIRATDLFSLCIVGSIFFHGVAYATYYIAVMPSSISSEDLAMTEIDVDFIMENLPLKTTKENSNPAPVKKKEWIEGSNKNKNILPEKDDTVDINALSGDGTDKDGYLYSFHGDRPPRAVLDFDPKQYFPRKARLANITNETVTVLIRVDEKGNLKSAKVLSARAGYGFEKAALAIVRRARFMPGYVNGYPVKMSHRLPVHFILHD